MCRGAHFVTDAKSEGLTFKGLRDAFVFVPHLPTGRPRARSYCIGGIFGFTSTDLRRMRA